MLDWSVVIAVWASVILAVVALLGLRFAWIMINLLGQLASDSIHRRAMREYDERAASQGSAQEEA